MAKYGMSMCVLGMAEEFKKVHNFYYPIILWSKVFIYLKLKISVNTDPIEFPF